MSPGREGVVGDVLVIGDLKCSLKVVKLLCVEVF